MRPTRTFAVAVAALALLASVLLAAGPAAGQAANQRAVTVGVDHATPPGHVFEYVSFFPSRGITVHPGDVVDFSWAQNPVGLHTATLLRRGLSPERAWSTVYPLFVPDDDRDVHLQLNPAANVGLVPSPGTPGGCGDATTPCSYDGTRDVGNGATRTDGHSHFFVRIDAPAGSHVDFVCLIHPQMKGSLDVATPAAATSSDGELAAQADQEFRERTAGGLAAELRETLRNELDNAAQDLLGLLPGFSGRPRVLEATAGAAAPGVEVTEMLPRELQARPGDVVRWRYPSGVDIHTVTFPRGTEQGEPLVPVCEGAPGPDSAFTPPATGPPCGDAARSELHVIPQPAGATSIATRSTFGTSGLLDADPASPLPDHFSFSFPRSGSFAYQCHVHDAMVGTVRVSSSGGGQPDIVSALSQAFRAAISTGSQTGANGGA